MNSPKIFEQNNITERTKKKSFGFWLSILLVLILFTQGARAVILFYDFPVFYNEQFAFSLNLPVPLMALFYIGALYFITRYLWQNWVALLGVVKFGFVLILAGGLANLFERVVYGRVADYIYIANGVLNIADFFILLGVGLIFSGRFGGKQ